MRMLWSIYKHSDHFQVQTKMIDIKIWLQLYFKCGLNQFRKTTYFIFFISFKFHSGFRATPLTFIMLIVSIMLCVCLFYLYFLQDHSSLQKTSSLSDSALKCAEDKFGWNTRCKHKLRSVFIIIFQKICKYANSMNQT